MLTRTNLTQILTKFGMADVVIGDPDAAGRWQLAIGEQRILASGGVAWTGRLVRDDGVTVEVANDGHGSINTYLPSLAAQVLTTDAASVFPEEGEPEALLLLVAEVYTQALRQARKAARKTQAA